MVSTLEQTLADVATRIKEQELIPACKEVALRQGRQTYKSEEWCTATHELDREGLTFVYEVNAMGDDGVAVYRGKTKLFEASEHIASRPRTAVVKLERNYGIGTYAPGEWETTLLDAYNAIR